MAAPLTSPACPNCDRPLPTEALADGWCPECGKRIPEFVRTELPRPPSPMPPPVETLPDPEENEGPELLTMLLVLAAAIVIGWLLDRFVHKWGWWVGVAVLVIGGFVDLLALLARRERNRNVAKPR